ncbi:hypothetical protein Salmuc_04828 [Salipiger mucosus DSM 16094]|uniref:Uncharacterized protein n=1 Tax=Salipiger mucosus DSM 16094 TaxID=1123237 RepID=S9R0Z2_9RHOB|nr:hypothetical protein Salmuc_04828 [Salipiger mucosus DSM 16094]
MRRGRVARVSGHFRVEKPEAGELSSRDHAHTFRGTKGMISLTQIKSGRGSC